MRILRNLNSKTKSMGDLMIRFEEMIIIDVFLDTIEGELM